MSCWIPNNFAIRCALMLPILALALAGCTPRPPTTAAGPTEAPAHAESAIVVDDSLRLLSTITLPGQPVALGFHEDGTGYLATYDGHIYSISPFQDGGEVEIRPLAEGLGVLKGLEVAGDTVFISSLGEICPDPAGMYCGSWDDEYGDEIEAEKGVLRTAQASVLALDILADGSLSAPRTVLDGLPVVTIGHSPNGLALGPDGRLYLAIGNLDKSYRAYADAPEEFRAENADIGLLGTILSFEPDGSGAGVFASGFRNVYDLAFDRDGRLYAADNDGPAINGPVFDEVNLVREGLFYGYPEYGSFTPEIDGVETPLWVITDGVGISGVESSDRIGYRSGVFVGQTGRMLYVRFEVENGRVYAFEYERTLIQATGIFTVIDADRAGHLFVGLFLQQGENRLLVLESSGDS